MMAKARTAAALERGSLCRGSVAYATIFVSLVDIKRAKNPVGIVVDAMNAAARAMGKFLGTRVDDGEILEMQIFKSDEADGWDICLLWGQPTAKETKE